MGVANPFYGTKWVCNVKEKNSMRINRNDPIPEGYVKGRTTWKQIERYGDYFFLSKEEKEIIRRKRISDSRIKQFANGTLLPCKHSDETKKSMSTKKLGNKSLTGRIWITNGQENKAILQDVEIPVGWSKGKKPR